MSGTGIPLCWMGGGGVKQKGFSDSFLGMDREQQDRLVTIVLWVLWPSMLFACVYFLFFRPPTHPPAKIYAAAYAGPKGCPKEKYVEVKLTRDGCFSPKTLIVGATKKARVLGQAGTGFIYTGESYKGGSKPYYFEFHRNDNDAIAIRCYNNRFYDNGCFIKGINKSVFVVMDGEK